MSKHTRQQPDRDAASPVPPSTPNLTPEFTPDFTVVPVRERHDGWTAHRQVGFIEALAETACVAEAYRHVGMSPRSAYSLKHRADALSFRQAWDIAVNGALGRVGEAAIGRALHGVVQPIFYKGEQVGERRVFNERLTTFLLSRGAPDRWGAWRERTPCASANHDGANVMLTEAIARVVHDAISMGADMPIPARAPLPTFTAVTDGSEAADLPGLLRLRDMEIAALRGQIDGMTASAAKGSGGS